MACPLQSPGAMTNNLDKMLFAAAGLASILFTGTAFAQTGADSDDVEVRANVVADFTVVGGGAVDLGSVFQGTVDDVLSDGSSAYGAAAEFDITGPNSIDWLITVVYNPLNGPGGSTITLSAPSAGSQICFQAGATVFPPVCNPLASGASPLTVPQAEHAGGGTAWVGFNVSVPSPTNIGLYSRVDAVVLTAEGILGS
jgi:hypothetical protein